MGRTVGTLTKEVSRYLAIEIARHPHATIMSGRHDESEHREGVDRSSEGKRVTPKLLVQSFTMAKCLGCETPIPINRMNRAEKGVCIVHNRLARKMEP